MERAGRRREPLGWSSLPVQCATRQTCSVRERGRAAGGGGVPGYVTFLIHQSSGTRIRRRRAGITRQVCAFVVAMTVRTGSARVIADRQTQAPPEALAGQPRARTGSDATTFPRRANVLQHGSNQSASDGLDADSHFTRAKQYTSIRKYSHGWNSLSCMSKPPV